MYFHESQEFPETMAWYMLRAFRAFCNSWKSFVYTHTVLVVVITPQ